MIEIKAPNLVEYRRARYSVFMAGSIEMGKAEDWQSKFKSLMADEDVLLLNPRRDDWDSSWKQSIDDPRFNKQVTWELNGIENADVVIFYFAPGTQSPITLMELGLATGRDTFFTCVAVCCPDGFWRKGNVEIVCDRFGIPMFDTIEDMAKWVKETR